ncbi:proline--tRNA ligase, partial [bacterium]|nr:proline--tRNA ligase [bacterium]
EAIGGNIGGSMTHEFQVLADSGEDEIMSCANCDYAANVEKAELAPPPMPDTKPETLQKEEISTPDKKSVEDVCDFLKVKPQSLVKTLIFSTEQGPVAALIRGDHSIKEAKLKEALGVEWCHMAEEGIIKEVTNAPAGFAGPIGLKIPVIADFEIEVMSNFVVGANKGDAHIINCNLRDINIAKFADIRHAVDGDTCVRCGGTLKSYRGIEVGQVFYLGTKYSEAMKAVYLDENGKEKIMVMGCYGIGIGRTAAAAIEQNHDDRGMIWPLPIAPFQVELIAVNSNDDKVIMKCEELYKDLCKNGVEVLYDDRRERPGVKFADADLIGIPYQILVGARGLKKRKVEFKNRRGGEKEDIKISKVVKKLLKELTN